MSIKLNSIVCDVCGIEKKSVNHWWWLHLEGRKFVSGSLKNQRVPREEDHHACGSDHAGTLYQRFMANGNLDKEMHERRIPEPVGLTEAGALGKEPAVEELHEEDEQTATEGLEKNIQ
jgi:hypothetical protein